MPTNIDTRGDAAPRPMLAGSVGSVVKPASSGSEGRAIWRLVHLLTGRSDPTGQSEPSCPEVDPTAARAPTEQCFSPRAQMIGLVSGPVGITVAAVLGRGVHGAIDYTMAWAAAGALFVVPALVLLFVLIPRVDRADRRFWLMWAGAQAGGSTMGLSFLLQPIDPAVLHVVGTVALAVASVVWTGGIAYLISRTDGSRILVIDGLEIVVAGMAVVAPVLVAVIPTLARAPAQWLIIPAAAAASGLPMVAVMTITLCVRLPQHQRRPELFGIAAAIGGECNAILLVADAVERFQLPAWPLLVVQTTTMWMILMVVVTAHKTYPDGLERLEPASQVRRWSPLPVLVALAVPALAVEGALDPRTSAPWTVPVVVSVLGALALLMTVRHALVLRETRHLYQLLAEQAASQRKLLADLARAIEDDRHRVVAQLHELAVEWMASIGAVVRAARSSGPADPEIVAGALERIYRDVNDRAELLRRLHKAVRPPEFVGQSLATAVAASLASIFEEGRAPTVEVSIAEDIHLDWMTSTIVYRMVLETLRHAERRAPVTRVEVSVAADSAGLELVVVDDATGRDLLSSSDEPRLTALRLFADLGGGSVLVEPLSGGGVRTTARLGRR